MGSDTILDVTDLVAGYVRDVDILNGINLILARGELVSIVGPNGAGKSTLVKSIVGLIAPRGGNIRLHGKKIMGERPHQIVRSGLGYVPQRANVFPSLSVDENLRLGCVGRTLNGESTRLNEVLEVFPRLRERRRQRAGTLSGGEGQMLAMGRSLMTEPDILLLDEPSAALSPMFVDHIFSKITDINANGTSILLIEQNARRALKMSHRGYVLELGRNRYEGRGPELLEDPRIVDLYLGGGTTRANEGDCQESTNIDERPGGRVQETTPEL